MKKRFFSPILFLVVFAIYAFPHGGWEAHMFEMMEVLDLDVNTSDLGKSHPNEKAKAWCKYISQDLIDKNDFHRKIKDKYQISFETARFHRYFFHWGYNAMPWSKAIEDRIRNNANKTPYSAEYLIKHIKNDLKIEQQRRNKDLNAKTENLFGFAHGGRDARYARFFAAMAYNIHILGDFTSKDNRSLAGLCNFKDLVGMIIVEIERFDKSRSSEIVQRIKLICKNPIDVQKTADDLMEFLKGSVPKFIAEAQDGSIRRRLGAKHFIFKKYKM